MSEIAVETVSETVETPVSDSQTATPEPNEPLGEPGLKALQAERAARAAAEAELAALRKEKDDAAKAAADAELTELQRAQQAAADAAAEAAAARNELRKTKIAAAHDVPAELLPDGDEAAQEAAALALTAWRGSTTAEVPVKRMPLPLPLQGNQQDSPADSYQKLFGGK